MANLSRKSRKKDDYPYRTLNLKLIPDKSEEEKIDRFIDEQCKLQDDTVNRNIQSGRLVTIPKGKKGSGGYLKPEEKSQFRDEIKAQGISGTFWDLAYKRGLSYYKNTMIKKTTTTILRLDTQIKKIEQENPDLMKPVGVWFQDVKPREDGVCAMCGTHGKMKWKCNEVQHPEYLCDSDALDFFKYRSSLFVIKRHKKENPYLLKDIVATKEVSVALKRLVEDIDVPKIPIEGTATNCAELKNKTVKINLDTQEITLKTPEWENFTVKFTGENYYNNYPKYGTNADKNRFRTLITEFLKTGYPSIFRRISNRKKEYFLSMRTHYPVSQTPALPPAGCILISDRSLMSFILGEDKKGRPEFINLHKPYLRKKIYDRRRNKVKTENKKLRIFNWIGVQKRPNKIKSSLVNKLGYTWTEDADVIVNGQTINIKANGIINKQLSIDISQNGTATMNMDGTNTILYIVGKENLNTVYLGLREGDVCTASPTAVSKKYLEGRMKHYIDHQNKVIARTAVEQIKQRLQPNKSVVVLDYTGIHSENEDMTTPRVALNQMIINMLRYDGIFGGAVPWKRVYDLTCNICHQKHIRDSETGDVGRLIIRDILMSKINRFDCDCGRKYNSGLVWVAQNIMSRDITELMKPLNIKEKQDKDYMGEKGDT